MTERQTVAVVLLTVLWTGAHADLHIPAEPTLQGRPLDPAGSLVQDLRTHQPAVGALPVAFVRSPDADGPARHGRYLVVVNSGYGIQFNAATNRAQQSLAVIDLQLDPPAVVQNVYFPSPQSVTVGAAFGPRGSDDSFPLYVSGGFQNRIWVFRFVPGAARPIAPASDGPDSQVTAPSIDVASMSAAPPSPGYNGGRAAVYPVGLAIGSDGKTLYTANDLGDSLGVVHVGARPRTQSIGLGGDGLKGDLYPYDVRVTGTGKVYVSLWGAGALAVVQPADADRPVRHIALDRHPSALCLNRAGSRLYVADSNADAVSVVDTGNDRVVERIDVGLAEHTGLGSSPEGLALSDDERFLYVANAHSNSVAVIALGDAARERAKAGADGERSSRTRTPARPTLPPAGSSARFPTGLYPSAVAVAGGRLFVGNGKGTGFANSSLEVNHSGFAPNAPNDRFPAEVGTLRGQYSVSLLAGNISMLDVPDEDALAAYTRTVLQDNGLVGNVEAPLFDGASPIKHVIYVIRENRTYDQVLGDVATAGDGSPADGDASLAIFGAGTAARHSGRQQAITPNAHALARRFGLMDRFFVNAEASPDGHNWSTAAFSNDYVDKTYRWAYSGRGRTYDYEGFNRLPNLAPPAPVPEALRQHPDAATVANYLQRYVPYLHGGRDVAEPESLYLWDAAARAGLSYRNYGEFVGTVSAADVEALRERRAKTYPDLSPVAASFATKRSLEGHVAPTFPNFDLAIPDAMTVESYRSARDGRADPAVTGDQASAALRGTSRFGAWLHEFEGFVSDREAGRPDRLPNLSIVRFSNDHTAGLQSGMPTPQFMVADNDYALGRLVQAVSHSPYWRDTAIFVVEDDAQAGPDHVDAHRSPALVISAYNRPAVLVHEYHNTVSLIRTIEVLLGMSPMNRLDAGAAPIRIFRATSDLGPYDAILPDVASDNLLAASPRDEAAAYWMERTAEQDLAHADLADPAVLNQVIWFSVRGSGAMPAPGTLPAVSLMLQADDDDEIVAERRAVDRHKQRLLSVLASLSRPADKTSEPGAVDGGDSRL